MCIINSSWPIPYYHSKNLTFESNVSSVHWSGLHTGTLYLYSIEIPGLYTQTCTYKYTTYEPPHDKTNKMACAPSEDSDQPGHTPSLISLIWVFAGRTGRFVGFLVRRLIIICFVYPLTNLPCLKVKQLFVCCCYSALSRIMVHIFVDFFLDVHELLSLNLSYESQWVKQAPCFKKHFTIETIGNLNKRNEYAAI